MLAQLIFTVVLLADPTNTPILIRGPVVPIETCFSQLQASIGIYLPGANKKYGTGLHCLPVPE